MNLFEIEILKAISGFLSNDFLDAFFKFVSFLGNKGAVWIIASVVMCIFPKTRKIGICSAISLLLCLVLGNMILKPLIGRIRPYEFDTGLNIIIPILKDASFPSGHTMAAFAFASSVGLGFKKYGIFLYAFAVLMGFSRIYLCVHYPTDVFFGALFGVAFGVCSHKIYNYISGRVKKNEK